MNENNDNNTTNTVIILNIYHHREFKCRNGIRISPLPAIESPARSRRVVGSNPIWNSDPDPFSEFMPFLHLSSL